MNKIHSKVWSPARNQFVVASEIAACPRGGAPGQGGRRALLGSRSPAVFAALVASGWLGWASLAQAQAVDCSVAPYNVYNSTASCMGFQSAASGTGATALGSLAHANVLGALAVGYNSLSTGQNGIAMGFQAYTNSINAIYLGARSAAGTGATAGGAIGIGTDVTASGANALAMGSLSVSASTNSVAFANSSSVDANSVNSIAIGYVTKVVNSNNAVALGSGSLVSGGTHGTAVGWQAYASALNAVYLGARTAGTGASAESAVGIGTDVSASGIYSIGMGLGANASAANAIAIGRASKAQAASTIAFGDSSTVAAAAGTGSIAGGHNSQVTGGTGAIALGEGQVANGNGAVAIGDPNVSFGTGAVTMGANNIAAGNAAGTVAANGAVAIGNSNSAIGQGSIALGNASTAAAAGGIALGDTANAVLGNGVAIGANSKANNANDVALGAGSTTAAPHTGVTAQFGGTAAGIANAANGVVSVGAAGTERQIQNVAAGVISATSTDAINGSQLNSVVTGVNNLGTTTASTLGGGAAYDPATGNVTGFSQPINSVSATGAVTGPTARTTVAGALTALNTNVDNTANIAVKYDAVGGTKITLGATGGTGAGAPVTITNLAPAALNATSTDAVNGSQLFGTNQNVANITNGKAGPFVSDNSVTAVQPVSSGANASAGGFGATATGAASTVLGNRATDNGNANATVLGQGASIAAGITGSNVALGQGSTVTTAAVPTTGATIGGTAYTFAGGAPAGVVSVGSAGNDRQITNVAAGQLSGASTDAVNGSQLFATNQQVTANSTAITNINNGGGIKYFHANSTLADSNAVGTDSIAVGPVANAYGNSSIAQGLNAVAGVSGTPATANDIALGNAAKATGGNSIAQGTGATANSAGAIAIGQTATATGGKAVSIGVGNTASGDGAVAIGDPNSAIGTGAIAMGANNTSNGQGAVALGNSNTATGQGSVALGNASNAAAAGAVALGDTAVANNTNDVALGSHSTTAAPHTGTTAQFGGTAAGVEAAASTNGVVSVGAVGTERQIQNVAAGVISATSTDAINGSQLNSVVTGVNNLGTTTASTLGGGAVYDPATGNIAGFSQPINAVSATGAVTGPTAQTTVAGALTALNTNVDNTANIAVKYDAVGGTKITLGATGGAGAGAPVTITNLAPAALNATSTDAVNGSQLYALTSGKTGPFVSDNSVTAVQPVSSGANASAGGFGATATGAASTVLGNQATDNGNANATVLGQGASIAAGTTGSNVALGQGSTVTTAAVPTTGATIGGTAYTFAGGAPAGVVSVGSAGNERQVTNVAAGQLSGASTDAVNGSQLFATNQQVTANTTAITNINNGGGIKYFHANSTLADSAANGTDSVAIGPVSTAGTTNAVSIGNGATAGANAGDVALGAGSTTAVAVGTPSTTIAGTTYNFVGTTPTSTVSVGAAGAERTITNVAAGRISGSSTDAINGSQLFATNQAVDNLSSTVTANATHYYSVNDNGTHGGNYTNNGATGINALAAGVGAVASADNSTSLGLNTNVSILGGVALGSGAVSDRAIAPSSGSILVGTNVIPYNTTDRILRGAVSVGNATDFRQITNVADGTTDQDAVTLRQLKGAMSSFSVTPIKYFHANSAATDSAAIGAESVAVGPKTTVNGDNGIGMGNGAIVQQTAPGGTAIGQNATVNLADGVALGTNATSNGIQAMALGAGTQAAFAGSVALGAGSKTDAAVGTASAIIAGTTYNFAGTTPGSTVSVGATGAERTITNVAAGQLNANSTDAVNGSQLNATNLAIAANKSHYYSVNDGGTQGGNYDNNGATGVDALAAGVGSSASAASDVAIGNSAAASGGSSIAIGQGAQASGANSISIGTGNVVSGASSVAIGDPTIITGTGSFSVGNNNNIASNNTFVFGSNVTVPAGLDGSVVLGSGSAAAAANPTSSATVNGTTYGGFAGTTPTSTVSVGAVGAERQITNVAAGQVTASSTDAINGSQLYSVANGLGTAINNLTTVVNANQFPIASSEGKAFTGSIGAAGSNSLGMGTNAVATGQNSTAAGQGSVASQANTTALGQGAQATAANSTALGQGAVASTGNSVAIGSASATTAAVATAGTTIRGTSYSFAGGAPVGTVSVGSAGNERQIQNVAAGQLSATSTDAINGSQLYATNSAINNLSNVVASTQTKYYSVNSSGGGNVNNDGATGADAIASGKNTTASGANAVAMGAGASATANNSVAIGAGSTADRAGLGGAKESFSNTVVSSTQGAVSVGSAGNERQITNVAGGTQATDAVNVRQLQAVQAGGVHYDTNTDGSTNYSSVTMGNGGSGPVAIHNVEAGTAATDAVNVSQLNTGLQQANQYASGLAMQLQNNINDVAKKAYAGVAAAMSMESAPYVAGKITYSAGYGYYQNQNAIGVSLRRTADNGRWSLSGGVSGTTTGGVAARLAVSGVLN
ncbi:ESPR-type extended signal peptide-containing protein [Collimonas sp. H4R21]|uniref:ESPR-type extended signal peptide-containing protein n=1 Tax=Collimonas rhizosphaerae TaxID=3126357 RepID=A0ABU9Q1W0_9BURK